jgi:outer membrane protein OmpA-like peptidoglycan-associated protein
MKNILLFAALLMSATVTAQWEVGLGLNAMNYQGDLVKPALFTVKETQPSFSLFARKPLQNQLALRVGLTMGKISGKDSNYSDRSFRGFKFDSPVTELAGMLEYQPLGWEKADGTTRKMVPYLFGGLGVALTNPKVSWNGNTSANVTKDKADLKKSALVIPLGAGFKIPVGRGTLGIEMGMRPAFSDYLDGVSEAGNPDRKDWYVAGGINYAFSFGGGKDMDTDGDGISDKRDKCPNAPGSKANNGCPDDKDQDGVADNVDKCPDVSGSAALNGCPEMSSTDKMVLTEAVSSIQFKTASAELENASFAILDKVADVLRRNPQYQVSIEGHTDSQGDDASNLALSQNRAKTCQNYLVSKGVDTGRIMSKGFGESKPKSSNETEEGRRMNRRVEFVLSIR